MVLYVLTQEFAEKAREYQENKRREEELQRKAEEVTKQVTETVTKEVTKTVSKQKDFEFAKVLKDDGVPLEKIIKYTKLSKEEIESLS